MVKLGPFVLHTLIGRGGASEVWQGSETATGHLVAVKIAHSPQAGDRPCSFLEEARRMVGLQHPGLIQLYDYGRLPTEVEAATSGLLPAGSPFLVMELAATGLHHYSGQLVWPVLARMLRSMLDALAYIHARDLLHCDLKPGNLLMARDLRQVKLSDFGIACHRDELAYRYRRRQLLGTPSYMSPEQFNRSWRDYGPWTDLYALGCAAVELLTGEPPYGHRQSLEEIKRAHLFEPFLPLETTPDVPQAFSTWLAQMLAKDPADRFQCAADARHGLEAMIEDLQELGPSEEPMIEEPRRKDPGFGLLPTLIETQPIHTFSTTSIPPSEDRQSQDSQDVQRGRTVPDIEALRFPLTLVPRPRLVPPLPDRWPDPPSREVPIKTYLTHPSLREAQSSPLQHRTTQQEALWSALHNVCRTGQSRFVCLEGKPNAGKSELLRWLWQSVHQTGAAICLAPPHMTNTAAILDQNPAESLAHMVMAYLRCEGLEGHALRYQISARMSTREPGPEDDDMRNTRVIRAQPWARLTQWLAPYAARPATNQRKAPPTQPDTKPQTHDTSPAERAASIAPAQNIDDIPGNTLRTELDSVDDLHDHTDANARAHNDTYDGPSDGLLTESPDVDNAHMDDAKQTFWNACNDFLEALCQQRPVLLCLDHLEQCDDALLDWCQQWCEPQRPHALMIVGTYTPQQHERHPLFDKKESPHRTHIQLDPIPTTPSSSPSEPPDHDAERSQSPLN